MSARDAGGAPGPRPQGPAIRRATAAALVLTSLATAMLAPVAGGPAAPVAGGAAAVRRAAAAAAFPAGSGKAIAERACLFCHSSMLVTQQAKDSTAWEKTLTQMVTWGAPMTPAEHDTLRTYLLAHFGPHPTSR